VGNEPARAVLMFPPKIIIPGAKQEVTISIDAENRKLDVLNPHQIPNLDVIAVLLQSALGVLQSESQARLNLQEQLNRQADEEKKKLDGSKT
jgi:hypothetical protein